MFVVEACNVVDRRIAPEFVGDSIMTDVEIADFPKWRGATVSFVAAVRENPWVPARIRVSWRKPPQEVRLGDAWRLELRLKRPRGSSNPGVYDYEGWLFRQRISATAYVVDSHRNQYVGRAETGVFDRIRQRVVDRLQAVVENPERAAVLAALSVGARHLVTDEQWNSYARTGTSHLMAISGLHVGMAATVTYFLVAAIVVPLGVSRLQHRAGSVGALAGALLYASVSGFAVPAQRATLMIALASVAVVIGREARPFRIVAIGLAVLGFLDPLATLSPGFMLSFLAVYVLLWAARQRRSGSEFVAGQLLRIQIALLAGLMPVTILLFSRSALAAPLVNLIAVPIFSVATVPFALFGLLLDGPLQPAGDLAIGVASKSLDWVERVIDLGMFVPAPPVSLQGIEPWAYGLLVLPAAWVVLPPGWPGRSIALVAAAAVLTSESSRPDPDCVEIAAMDVGQGLAISVLTQSSSLLYDTGPAYFTGGNAADSVVVPYLRSRGVQSLDTVVISHADLDHAGGFGSVIREFPVGRVFVGESAGSAWLASPCQAGTAWAVDGVRFRFIHPHAGKWRTGNDASCVLEISTGSHRALFAGDIEQAAETSLVRSGDLRPVDVVIVPHHGSRTSSTGPFVKMLRPELAIVSAGYDNRWGQPHPDVVERWRGIGAEVLVTAASGAIAFTMCKRGGIAEVNARRDRHRRIWHE